MPKPQTILFVVNSISGGGAENSIGTVTKLLSGKGLNIHLCALNLNDKNELELNSKQIHILNREWKGGLIKTFMNFVHFRSLVKKLEPQILVANCELPELYVSLAAPKKSRIICVEHTSRPWKSRKLVGFLVRITLKARSAEWLTVSSTKQSIWLGAKFPLLISNPIAKSPIVNTRNCHVPHLTFVGRLRPEKRPEWVILAGAINSVDVELFGDGTLRKELEARYHNISSEIRFYGYVTDPWQKTCKKSIVVVPSEYEGDGLVVVEAISRGYSILLMDNPDLRKFGLPDEHYFKSQIDLVEKVGDWIREDCKSYKVPEIHRQAILGARSADLVSYKWEKLLSFGSQPRD